MGLVELAKYPNRHEAELARERLEGGGIFAVCFDGGMNIAEGIGLLIPVRPMVLDDDVAAASAHLSGQ